MLSLISELLAFSDLQIMTKLWFQPLEGVPYTEDNRSVERSTMVSCYDLIHDFLLRKQFSSYYHLISVKNGENVFPITNGHHRPKVN